MWLYLPIMKETQDLISNLQRKIFPAVLIWRACGSLYVWKQREHGSGDVCHLQSENMLFSVRKVLVMPAGVEREYISSGSRPLGWCRGRLPWPQTSVLPCHWARGCEMHPQLAFCCFSPKFHTMSLHLRLLLVDLKSLVLLQFYFITRQHRSLDLQWRPPLCFLCLSIPLHVGDVPHVSQILTPHHQLRLN